MAKEHAIDYDIAMEVGGHEAIVRQAYLDSKNVWTWSVGLTSATGHNVERYKGKPQSLDHCLRVYAWALDNYADAVRKVFKGVSITKAQFAAALSFHWNTGAIEEASWVKLFKAGKIAEAKKAFMRYNKPAEIVGRRQAERDLFFDGKWSNTGKITEYTRVSAAGKIDWKSAKHIDISKELRAALAGEIPASDKVIVERQVEVDKPVAVAPAAIDKPIQQTSGFWERLSSIIGLLGIGSASWLGDWKVIVAIAACLIVVSVIGLILHQRIISAVKQIKTEIREGS